MEDDYDPDLLEPVRGVVIDPNGQPVPRARVVLRLREKGLRFPEMQRAASDDLAERLTDAAGQFEFRGISPPLSRLPSMLRATWRMSLDVVAAAPGLGLGWFHLEEPGTIEVELSSPAHLAGRVLDSDERPVAGAEVKVLFLMARDHLAPSLLRGRLFPLSDDSRFVGLVNSKIAPASTKTDSDGRFALEGTPAGYGAILEVTHPDHERQLLYALTSPGRLDPRRTVAARRVQQGDDLVARFPKKHFVAVRGVYEDTGETAVRTRSAVSLPGKAPVLVGAVAEFGQHPHEAPAPLPHRIHVAAPPGTDYVDGEESVVLTEELLEREVVVRLPRGVPVSGRVVDETGRGVPNATINFVLIRPVGPLKDRPPTRETAPEPRPRRIRLWPPAEEAWTRTATADANGRFRQAVPLGSIAVSVSGAPDRWRIDPGDVRYLIAGRTQTHDAVVFPLKSQPVLRGIALGPDGRPVPRAEIIGRIRVNSRASQSFHGSTDGAGRFELIARAAPASRGNAAGGEPIVPMSIVIRHDPLRLACVAEFAADVPLDRPCDVRLEPMCAITGRVVDTTTGDPLEWASLCLRRRTSRSPAIYEVDDAPFLTKADGRFSFLAIAHEEYHLDAIVEGYFQASKGSSRAEFQAEADLDVGDLTLAPARRPAPAGH